MSKAQLLQTNDDLIRNKTPEVIKIEHADVNKAIVNEFYGELVREYSGAPVLTIPNNHADFPYGLDFVKQGRRVYITGFVRQKLNTTQSNFIFFTFRDKITVNVNGVLTEIPNPYLPDETLDNGLLTPNEYYFEGITGTEEKRIRLRIAYDSVAQNSKMRVVGEYPFLSIGSGIAAYVKLINASYNTKS